MGTFSDRSAGIAAVFNRFNSGTAYSHKVGDNTFGLTPVTPPVTLALYYGPNWLCSVIFPQRHHGLLFGAQIGCDVQSHGRGDGLALTGGLEALEFMERPV